MLLEDKTLEQFGYSVSDLSKHSKKPILVLCDYCGIEYSTIVNNRANAHKVIQKDACKKCKYIKMAALSELKYGVRSTNQLDSVKKKMMNTNLERYGVTCTQQDKDIRNKSKQTCMEKYGAETPFGSQQIVDKTRATCQKKYGYDFAASSDTVKEKSRKTCLERFGKDTYLGSDTCLEQTKATLGVANVFQLDSTKAKSKATLLAKYGVDHAYKVPEFLAKAKKAELKTKAEKGQIIFHQGKQIKDWAEITGFSKSAFGALVKKHGWDIAVNLTPKMSSLETLLESYLIEIGVAYQKQVRIGKYVADFVVGKVIVEVDGLFWHSEYHKENNYHIKKREAYVSAGYFPLFFREDEILSNFDIVKSIIGNKLRLSQRLFARKLKISPISKDDGNEFLSENHLMGQGKGFCFALIDDDEIVAVMRMVKIKDGYEISRFACKSGYSIIGGFSRLLSFFTGAYGSNRIVTFIDLRYGSGDYLVSLGFTKGKSFPSFKWTDGKATYHRMNFRSNSGRDSGLYKIWDCGQLKYTIDR
jgi:very-short-patch-repair endonuclease